MATGHVGPLKHGSARRLWCSPPCRPRPRASSPRAPQPVERARCSPSGAARRRRGRPAGRCTACGADLEPQPIRPALLRRGQRGLRAGDRPRSVKRTAHEPRPAWRPRDTSAGRRTGVGSTVEIRSRDSCQRRAIPGYLRRSPSQHDHLRRADAGAAHRGAGLGGRQPRPVQFPARSCTQSRPDHATHGDRRSGRPAWTCSRARRRLARMDRLYSGARGSPRPAAGQVGPAQSPLLLGRAARRILDAESALRLQRSAGNAAVAGLCRTPSR
jgi:hypothetical protein